MPLLPLDSKPILHAVATALGLDPRGVMGITLRIELGKWVTADVTLRPREGVGEALIGAVEQHVAEADGS